MKFYSDYPESFSNPDDPATRGEHFFTEAVDLLRKEEGRVPLTTFQAWGDMYTRYSLHSCLISNPTTDTL